MDDYGRFRRVSMYSSSNTFFGSDVQPDETGTLSFAITGVAGDACLLTEELTFVDT